MTTDWALVQAGDQDTIEALLHRHEPLVLNIVGRFAKPSLTCFDDLKQGGMIALWHALTSFDPTRGTAFSTWAFEWIINAVSHEASHSGVIRTAPINKHHSEETNLLKRRAQSVGSLVAPDGICQAVFFAKTPDPADALEQREEYYRSMGRYYSRMNILGAREWCVVRDRLDGATFKAIGRDLGITRQRAKQIWDGAMKKLRWAEPYSWGGR